MTIFTDLTASDALALSMLCVIMLSISFVFSLVAAMFVKVKKAEKEPDLFEGLEELLEPEEIDPSQNKRRSVEKTPLAEWEKDGDWWK